MSSTGLLSAIAPGTSRVIEYSRDVVDGTRETVDTTFLTVYGFNGSVQISPDTLELSVGETGKMSYQAFLPPGTAPGTTLDPVAPTMVAWTTRTPSVATIDSTGSVKAASVGLTVVILNVGGKIDSAAVRVTKSSEPTLTLNTADVTVPAGATYQLAATTEGGSNAAASPQPAQWSSADTSIATVSQTGLVTAVAVGTTSITATAQGLEATARITVISAASPEIPEAPLAPTDAELPRTYLNTSVAATPSAGRTLNVAAGGNLQAALDSAQPGDNIVLACGASFAGNFIAPAKSGSGWITLTSSGCASVAEGQRMTPTLAANLPKLKSLGPKAALRFAAGARQWRVMLVEIMPDASAANNTWGLISIGEGNETSLAQLPSDIIVDRVYAHGTPTFDCRRAVTTNGARVAVIDSWLSEIHSKFDAQGIGGWNGPGPYKYVNNYIEASGEGIASGGADPTIANLVPSDFEIRRNHITKNLAWRGTWIMKNLIEFKNAQRALIDGNILENSPLDAQAGFAFVLWSVNQQNTAPWSVTQHITVTNNIVRQVAAGFQLDAKYSATSSPAMNHITIRNNVILGLDAAPTNGNGRIFQISNVIPQLTIEHNTAFSPSNSTFIWNNAGALPDHRILNNLAGGGMYQIFNGLQGKPAWDQEAGPGSAFRGNVVALFSGAGIGDNHYPGSLADLGLVGGGTAAYNPSATLSDLALSSSSRYKNAATDGSDPGANIAAVIRATQNVKLP